MSINLFACPCRKSHCYGEWLLCVWICVCGGGDTFSHNCKYEGILISWVVFFCIHLHLLGLLLSWKGLTNPRYKMGQLISFYCFYNKCNQCTVYFFFKTHIVYFSQVFLGSVWYEYNPVFTFVLCKSLKNWNLAKASSLSFMIFSLIFSYSQRSLSCKGGKGVAIAFFILSLFACIFFFLSSFFYTWSILPSVAFLLRQENLLIAFIFFSLYLSPQN